MEGKERALTVTLESIQAARQRIRGHIYLSPARHSAGLSEITGQQVFLKLDNLQRTGAFKERGALNKILTLTEEERARGVIAASAGNHAQAVAFHASQNGIRARIVMPLMTPLVKVASTSGYGADVVLHGANYDEACAEAIRQSEADGLTFLHPFDDDGVIAGQGTIGLELLEQVEDLEAVVAPIGGGGLIGGVACAIKESRAAAGTSPVRVIGVQTERLPSMLRAREAGHPVTIPAEATIADGIAVRRNLSRLMKRRSPAPSSFCWNGRRRWPKARALRPWRRCCRRRRLSTGSARRSWCAGGTST